jgi:steroid delta-isomerase-like uncharacterized protein
MSSRRALEAVATQWISLWCTPVDWPSFDRLHAEHFEDAAAAGRPPTKAGFAAGLAEMARAFPDLRAKVEQLVIDEPTALVAVHWSARGTNRARFLGIGPTGRPTTITGIEIIRVAEGCIVQRWGEWDITDHADRAVRATPVA